MNNKIIHLFLMFIIFFLASCASDSSSSDSGSAGYIPYNAYSATNNSEESNSGSESSSESNSSNSDSESENGPKYIRFKITVPGEVKGSLYYCILLNTEAQPIQVDDIGTYTDVIRICNPESLDAPQYHWYHRLNAADRLLTIITDLNNYVSYSSDKTTVFVTFPLKESSVFKNQIQGNSFTTQVLVTTAEKEVGKFIDTLGPDLSSSTHYSFMVNPNKGVVSSSIPSGYPSDSLYDYYESNIPSNTPNENADIMSYSVEVF